MTRKPIGSQWLFNPAIAGYGTVWRPAVCTIHHHILPEDVQPPAKNGNPLPPKREYAVTLPGGLFLFANDEALSDKDQPLPVIPSPPVKTREEVIQEEARGLAKLLEVDLGMPSAS